MKIDWNKKYTTIAVYVFLTAAAFFLFLSLFIYSGQVIGLFKKTLSFLSPVIYGIIIAYLLLPIDRQLLKLVDKLFPKSKKSHHRLHKAVSISITYILFLGVLSGFVLLVLPDIIDSATEIAGNLRTYYTTVSKKVQDMHIPFLSEMDMGELVNYGVDFAKSIIPAAAIAIIEFATEILNIIIGLLISIYVLAGRGRVKRRSKKMMYAFFKRKTVARMLAFFDEVNRVFGGFIRGKLLDSLIIGVLAFFGLWALGIQNAALLAVIIGVTNIIPFFGPFIGAVPSGLIVLAVQPEKTIWFIIFVIVLQQFDGNILGPKILGDSTGLPAFWVIFSLLLFGGFFGVVGMIIAVPIFALVFVGVKHITEAKLAAKGLPTETGKYKKHIDVIAPLQEDEKDAEKADNDMGVDTKK